jgi:hypothetical protein
MKFCFYLVNFFADLENIWCRCVEQDLLSDCELRENLINDSHTLLSDCELRENLINDSHTLLRGLNEFVSILSTLIIRFWFNLV